MANKQNQEVSVEPMEPTEASVETIEDRSDLRGSSKLTRDGKDYVWNAETKNSTFHVAFTVQGHSVEVTEYTITRTVGDTEYRQSGTNERIDVSALLIRAFRHIAIDPSAYRRLRESGETLESIIGSKGKGGSKGGSNAPSKAEVEVLRAAARIVPGMRLTGATWSEVALAVAGHPVAVQMARAALTDARWETLRVAALKAAMAADKAESKGN